MYAARNKSWCEGTSASAGASRRVGANRRDIRMSGKDTALGALRFEFGQPRPQRPLLEAEALDEVTGAVEVPGLQPTPGLFVRQLQGRVQLRGAQERGRVPVNPPLRLGHRRFPGRIANRW